METTPFNTPLWIRRVGSALILIFLAVQLIVPLRGLIWDRLETRGDFSWNMYSKSYECRSSYFARYEDGRIEEIDYRSYFARPQRSTLALHRDRLPTLHAFLCEELKRQGDGFSRLDGFCACSHNRSDYYPLVDPDADLCTAPNFGVLSAEDVVERVSSADGS